MPVINVTPGIVRNLLKTTYYLRIPHQSVRVGQKHDRHSTTIALPPNQDVTVFWKDFDAIEDELKRLEKKKILRIIQYPKHMGEGDAGVADTGIEIPFVSGDWNINTISIIPAGVPGAGQIGPHTLPLGKQYVVTAFKVISPALKKPVGLDLVFNPTTGVINMTKAPSIQPFDGLVVISFVV